MKSFISFLALFLLGILLVAVFDFDHFPPETMKNYYFQHGSSETGAMNLVTAIYLGYRVFDTFGETIVLLLSITGILFLLGNHHV